MTDIIIIGAGPAGLTSAIYAIRAGMSAINFESTTYGGQLINTAEVENYPAVQKISGWQLAQNIYDQATIQGANIKLEPVVSVKISDSEKIVVTSSCEYRSKALIIANGAKRRKLNCPGETEFTGKGVSYCATCDGAFFRNKKVAVIGGGNTALEDALFLSNICEKVYLVHRRDTFRAEKHFIDSIKSRKNVELVLCSTTEKINGDNLVRSITVSDTKNGLLKEIFVDGVFVAIGLEPDNKMFSKFIDLDDAGYIKASEDCATNVKGVFAAGDTRTKILRQIVTATADGAVAAVQASNMINSSVSTQ